MDQWTVDEAKLLFLAENLTTVLSPSPLSLVHSGITIYDAFGLNEHDGSHEKSSKKSKSLLQKGRSELELLLYESKRKPFVHSFKSPSEGILQGILTKQDPKKRKSSHQAWNNRQLIKVYGMRYARSVRNLRSFTKSPRKFRLNSMTPTKNLK
jgi:hypothetical protein